jgi:serine O-acetyltransferase
MSDVTIGAQGSYDTSGAPQIGNRVYIGSGARVIGNIKIADDVVIGANAVVTKDILESGTTWAGIPARKIANKGSAPFLRLPKSDKSKY